MGRQHLRVSEQIEQNRVFLFTGGVVLFFDDDEGFEGFIVVL